MSTTDSTSPPLADLPERVAAVIEAVPETELGLRQALAIIARLTAERPAEKRGTDFEQVNQLIARIVAEEEPPSGWRAEMAAAWGKKG